MKIVTIPIKVEVSEWATHVAVDRDGAISEYGCEPEECEYTQCWDINDKNTITRRFRYIDDVINWRETLTEVK